MWNKYIAVLILMALSVPLSAESIDGRLDWADRSRLAFGVDGLLQQLRVHGGDKVKKAQLLAQLEQQPFELKVQKMQAKLDQLKPRLFDAKLELERAEELYDRTVLSEIELQKVRVIYQALLAEQSAAMADLSLARYEREKSRLKAVSNGRVIQLAMGKGDVISPYNRDRKYIELASVDAMLAVALISPEKARHISPGTDFQVQVAGHSYRAQLYELSMVSGQTDYQLKLRFDVRDKDALLAGMGARIEYRNR